MRSAWISDLSGHYGEQDPIRNPALWAKVTDHKIERVYLPVTDTHTTGASIDYLHAPDQGRPNVEAGIWLDANEMVRANLAPTLGGALARLGVDFKQCAVHAQVETWRADELAAFLLAWRMRRPTRATGLVLEGIQGGRFDRELLSAVNADPNLELYAEAYTDTRSPLGDDRVRSNLVASGVERKRALVMYDAKTLVRGVPWWDGCAFDLEHLP